MLPLKLMLSGIMCQLMFLVILTFLYTLPPGTGLPLFVIGIMYFLLFGGVILFLVGLALPFLPIDKKNEET